MKDFTLEVCVADIESAIAATEGGAGRIELCSALGEGGVTPSLGLTRTVRGLFPGKMHVLIRPRGGDFVYTSEEIQCMINDIRCARECGADGVVIGALLPDGSINIEACELLVNAASGMSVTFHRAFDLCKNPSEGLEEIIALGCDRVLTSGQAPSAIEGAELIAKLNRQANGRIMLLPGGGVNAHNAPHILTSTGCTELHASARHSIPSPMIYRHSGVAMGNAGNDEYIRCVTSSQIVAEIIEAMNKLKS